MRRVLAVIASVAVLLAGCSSPERVSRDAAIQVTRVGGAPHVNDRLELQSDGSWSFTDTAGKRFSGTLAPDQLTAAYALVTSDEFAEEMVQPTKDMMCADAPVVTVTAGGRKSTYFGCFEDKWPKTAALVDLLQRNITVPNGA
ncbi:MAG: hypothetical protein HOU81_03670 [Hamadaea sp.]|uniref:hypothetical protein n=1 Tax=Hamadaea sp. TaxID=2024425 RepID=UPI0017EA671D|nr:hypothetical protein [Hamadaea sp.]NUR69896.1 hypothetical protein [Hamadaea sp.]NUT22092.1 hypothetical protein [Hamadaea sp.]